MFEEANPNTPWWVAGSLGIVTVVLAALRVYDYYKRLKPQWDTAQHKADIEVRRELTQEQREARRDSEEEAWRVVDRLRDELVALTERLAETEERERECTEGRAVDRTVLQILVAWAQRQKNPPPIPAYLLAQFVDGSGPHIPLPPDSGIIKNPPGSGIIKNPPEST